MTSGPENPIMAARIWFRGMSNESAGGNVVDDPAAKPSIPTGVLISLLVAVMILTVTGAAYGVWHYAGQQQLSGETENGIPVVRAPDGEIKHKPVDAGGLKVPFQDKAVYERIKASAKVQLGERLLPPPEVPVQKPDPVPAPAPKVDAKPKAKPESKKASKPPPPPKPLTDAVEKSAAKEQPAPTKIEPPKQTKSDTQAVLDEMRSGRTAPPDSDAAAKAPKPPAAPAIKEGKVAAVQPPKKITPPVPKPVQKPVVKPEAKPAPTPTPKPAAAAPAGSFVIQLAAYRERAVAEGNWRKMQGKHAAELGGLSPFVNQVDIEGKGTYFRLQAGPLSSRAEATDLCVRLKARKQGCFVVRR